MSRHHDAHELERTNRIIAGITTDLRTIAEHYDAALYSPMRPDDNQGGGSSSEKADPVRVDIIDARTSCMRDLVSWVNFILQEVNDGTITYGPRTMDVAGLTEFVGRWTPAIVDQMPDDTETLIADMGLHASRLEALAKGWVVKRMQVGRCPEQTIVVSKEGVEEFHPCTGTLWAVIHSRDTDLPKDVQCDAGHGHTWSPWQWRDLGRRLGRSLQPDDDVAS